MEVWDESSEDRRSNPLHRRIRQFHDWKDVAVFVAEVAGLATVGGSFVVFLLSSMGFTFSGSGQAIAEMRAANVVRDTAIAKATRQGELLAEKVDDMIYMVCEQTKREDPRAILPRSCK